MLLYFCWAIKFFILINFSTYYYTFSNISSSFLPFYLLTTIYLDSLFLYLFIFLYFWLFLFPSSYYKFVILSPILCMFSHTKAYFSFSLNFFFIFRWIFLFFLHLYFWLVSFLYYLELYFGLMWFIFVFLYYYLFYFLDFIYVTLLHYKDNI